MVGSDVDPWADVGSLREVGLGVESLPPLPPFFSFLVTVTVLLDLFAFSSTGLFVLVGSAAVGSSVFEA